jgi:hypothetical protein
VGRNLKKKGEIFPAPHAENGSKDSKWWSLFLSLISREYIVNDNGSGWLK